jgi:hypothetical protein
MKPGTGQIGCDLAAAKERVFRKDPINYYLTVHRTAMSREGSFMNSSVSSFTPTGV